MNLTYSICVSKGVAILLLVLQILEFLIPILYLLLNLYIGYKKNIIKEKIMPAIYMSIAIFIIFFGMGKLILDITPNYGYSSKTADYIKYNGKIIFYHR